MNDLPDPLVPMEVDLRDFAGMWLDVDRVLKSETWRLGTSDEKSAAITLWMESWHEVPAGSLPNNDRLLGKLSQAERWSKSRAHALRGWVECNDGRLYHPVVAEKALEAWIEKLSAAISGAVGNAKRWQVDVDTSRLRGQFRVAVDRLRAIDPASRVLKKKSVAMILAASPPDSPPDIGQPSPPESPPDAEKDRPPIAIDQTGPDQTGPDLHDSPPPEVAPPAERVTPVEAKPARAKRVERPDDVDPQVWDDWLALRKAKKAPVSPTVLAEAVSQAAKAGMSLEAFLRVWCRRGTQGLEADWLKPHERQVANGHGTEPAWRTEQRERTAQFAGRYAARPPAAAPAPTPQQEIIDAADPLG